MMTMNEKKIELLLKYLELILQAQKQEIRMNREFFLVSQELQMEFELEDAAYIIVQNGQLKTKNCVFEGNLSESTGTIEVVDGKLILKGCKITGGKDLKSLKLT